MGIETWNFPTWMTGDISNGIQPPDNTRGAVTHIFGPAISWAPNGTAAFQPFTDKFTMIGSFLQRTGWSNTSGAKHGIMSIGVQSGVLSLGVSLETIAGDQVLRLQAGAAIYDIRLGDEDGANWIQADKWYQFGFSMDASAITYAMNGDNTPKVTETTNSPAAIALDAGNDRIWYHGPMADNYRSFNVPAPSPSQDYPSLLFGPCLMDSVNVLDFDNAAVRARIWDGNGDFKFPGKDGSLWLDDTYGSKTPLFYMPNSSLFWNYGSYAGDYYGVAGAGSQLTGWPAGLRKQYE